MAGALCCEKTAATDGLQKTFATPLSSDETDIYLAVTFEEGCRMTDYKQAAHVMIYAMDDRILWDKYKVLADILMQVRFNGTFGFSGGLIDKTDASIVDGLNRELAEEINLDLSKHHIEQKDYIVSHCCAPKKLVTHFYAIEVSVAEFREIEKRVIHAPEWGTETMGIFRVPLYTMNDGARGLPLFLAGRFIGNSKQQMIDTLLQKNIISKEELDCATVRSKLL